MQVALNWTAAAGAVSYQVNRGTTNGGPYGTVVASGLTATSVTDNTVVNGTTYYYVVVAVNSGGVSPNSNQASATPAAAPNPVLEVNAGGGSVGDFAADLGFSGGRTGSATSSLYFSRSIYL